MVVLSFLAGAAGACHDGARVIILYDSTCMGSNYCIVL